MKSNDLNPLVQPSLVLSGRALQVEVPADLLVKVRNMTSAIALCVQLSGLQDNEVYLSLSIDAGHWSRIKRGEAHFPVDKLGDLMDLCGNEAPLLWLAQSRGYGVVLLKTEAERRAEIAEARADEAEKKLAWAMEVVRGVKAA